MNGKHFYQWKERKKSLPNLDNELWSSSNTIKISEKNLVFEIKQDDICD